MHNRDMIDEILAEIEAFAHKHPWLMRWYRLKRFLSVRNFVLWIKKATIYNYQRSQRGFSTYDAVSLDTYLAKVIVDSVTHLKMTTYGCPADTAQAIWHKELQTIIDGFQAYLDYESATDQQRDMKMAVFNKGMGVFARRFPNLWK